MRGFHTICLVVVANVALRQVEAIRLFLDAKGIIAPVFTPMDKNDKVNLAVIPQYAQYLRDNGVDGVLVDGTAGEGPSLTVYERKQLINAWVNAAGPLGLYIIVQVGGIPLPYAVELAKYSDEIGVSAILCLADLYFKPKTPSALVYNLQFVARAAPNTPFLFDDLPGTVYASLDIVEFFQLATQKIPNFKGINTYSLSTALKLEDLLIDDQRIFIEDSVYLAPGALLGYKNYILFSVNYLPKLVDAIVKNGVNGYRKTTKSQYRKLRDIRNAIVDGGNEFATQKAATEFITGLELGDVRPPLMKLSDEQKNGIRERLRQEGVRLADDSS